MVERMRIEGALDGPRAGVSHAEAVESDPNPPRLRAGLMPSPEVRALGSDLEMADDE